MPTRKNESETSQDKTALVQQVFQWLSEAENNQWLLIYDNVDREWLNGSDPLAYDLKRYLPAADHGAILVTTRLIRLAQLGESESIDKVSELCAGAMLDTWQKDANGMIISRVF